MKEANLKLAQQDIDEALKTVEDLENHISNNPHAEKNILKEKFISLSEKVQELENLLKSEGII